MNDTLADRLCQLQRSRLESSRSSSTNHDGSQAYAWLQDAPSKKVQSTLEVVLETPISTWLEEPATISPIWVELVRRQQTKCFSVTAEQLAALAAIYGQLQRTSPLRPLVLRFLIACGTEPSLRMSGELLVTSPPAQARVLLEIFGDLLRVSAKAVSVVFPRLLDGLNQPELAIFVLDLANFVRRKGLAEEHPAALRSGQLIELLSGLADRLGKLQDSRPASQEEVADLGRRVNESVALGVSLCDALALIGDREAIASLYKALEVEHRRLRVEAAAALAKLGEEHGREVLPALAAEPVERLRVLAYAEELGLLDKVSDEFASPVARLEGEFVLHLAQPTKFGLAPHRIELVDEREQMWPGFDDPQTCCLFQFVYQFASGEFTNIGIAGPVAFSFDTNLTVLSYDDIYALFAGWHVQHPEIYAVEPNRAVGQDQTELGRLQASLREEGYEDSVPSLLGHFLGRRLLVASACRGGENGWATVSEDSYAWWPLGDPERPLGAEEAFYLVVGRALLSSFNVE